MFKMRIFLRGIQRGFRRYSKGVFAAPVSHPELHFIAVHLVPARVQGFSTARGRNCSEHALLGGHGRQLAGCWSHHAEAADGSGTATACKGVLGVWSN